MSVRPIVLDPTDEEFEPLRCPCGTWSRLSLDPADVLCGGILVSGHLPSLVCDQCGVPKLPHKVKLAMQDMANAARKRGRNTVGGWSPIRVPRLPDCRS